MSFLVKPVLTGERTVLRPFTEADAEAMWRILEDPEVLRFTSDPSGDPADGPSYDSVRSWYATRTEQPDRLDLAVTDRETGEVVGEVVLNEWEPHHRSCNFRTLIGPRGRDRGLGTEAVRLIVGHGFERLGLHRISLEVYGDNPRARRAYEKVGFVTEGVLRESSLREGAWVDEVQMAILDREWARHRGRPEEPDTVDGGLGARG
ncbi:GNAT family N-acetyltransferase [Streptomyces sp. NPDC088789]|uniref:GNAT family N-acetyltransferase n=1 Tax=Streptomyces sp. NPDC088789 TaxID=3365899 RepID=UPI0037FAB9EE